MNRLHWTWPLLTRTFRQISVTACSALLFTGVAAAADLQEPITLASDHGVLNLLMVAKAGPIETLPGTPTGWVYDICERPAGNVNTCPSISPSPNLYGGTLLQLQKGDTLNIRLVNDLPVVTDSKHAIEPGLEYLALNPTNIHTHGMLVAPATPTPTNPTYGDYIFVLTFNSTNGMVNASPHMHADVRYDYTDYSIKVPANHPSGLFWFHPHAHGVALNQVSAGMAGNITVGNITDYANIEPGTNVRHMMLKDAQIRPDGSLQDQEDPMMCNPDPVVGEGPRQGFCPGQDNSAGGGNNYTGGNWYFTVNGQQYPNIPVQGGGEVWRLTNTSGSRTYDLNLWNDAQSRNMLFQILSVDGVAIDIPAGATAQQIEQIAGAKFKPVLCPGTPANQGALCADRLLMMPSSRVEVLVAYRDAQGNLTGPPVGAAAIFRAPSYNTGPSGDSWPQVDLASVQFLGGPSLTRALTVHGEAGKMAAPTALASDMEAQNHAVAPDPTCKPLPPGHMRRIYFAVPTTNLNGFGLAYEEIDEQGHVVGTPATDVKPFDPMTPTICLPLGPNNTTAVERWQLVNLATENHNFHIHQTKFRILGPDEITGAKVPSQVMGKGVELDNVPLMHAAGTCGNNPPDDSSNPIADFRKGLCQPNIVTVEIPFAIAGDFVYHCHILEHEDGGMMARIRVRPRN